jgi:trehalose 6-phosphate phosphatase
MPPLRQKNGPQLKARPKFREETPRRRTVRPQPAIVTALHNLMHCAAMSSDFFETFGIVGDFRPDQGVRPHPAATKCASHKDVILTMDDLAVPSFVNSPPKLDRHAALFLDVDGTLLEIAARSDLVRVPAGLPGLLGDLADERGGALALISGRPLAELDWLFGPWRGAAAGVHGSERRRADGTLAHHTDVAAAAALDQIRPLLAAFVRAGSGLLLEDKRSSLALHYRAAPERAAEVCALAETLVRQVGTALRLIVGKMVVEFQPRGANKGEAISAFLTEPPFLGRPPIFLGDDATDEDGFAEIDRRGGVAIRVGEPAETRAGYALPSVAAVLAWLAEDQHPA